MNWKDYIHSDENVLMGKPVIKGTRISVELILELLAGNWTEEMILESYPTVSKEAMKAVYNYLHECIQQELFFPIKKSA
jgi:uncharacterized protein (DUF433 family)